jgi:hypothetical protein
MSENRNNQTNFGLDSVTIRRAGAGDEPALRRLAERDTTTVPEGPVLMAEAAGKPVAAISLLSGESFADPFVSTLEVRRLLELRVSQLHLSTARPRRRGLRPRDYRVWRTTGRRLALASSRRRTGVV